MQAVEVRADDDPVFHPHYITSNYQKAYNNKFFRATVLSLPRW